MAISTASIADISALRLHTLPTPTHAPYASRATIGADVRDVLFRFVALQDGQDVDARVGGEVVQFVVALDGQALVCALRSRPVRSEA
jgi:hypothetical protein